MFKGLQILGALFIAAGAALAHAEPSQDPSAIERTIPRQVTQEQYVPRLSIPVQGAPTVNASHQRFTLGAVNIYGASVFSPAQLSRYFEPYLATEVDQAELAKIAGSITKKYRDAGYLLSYAKVPLQNVEAGMVRIQVVEGRIAKVNVEGAGSAQGVIQSMAAPLVRSVPLKKDALERTLGLLRDFPGLRVTDVALVRSEIEGEYVLKITVLAKRLRGFAYIDNRGTGSFAGTRVYGSVSISSVAIKGDDLRIDAFSLPGDRSNFIYGQALASVPIGYQGLRLSFSASSSNQYLRSEDHFRGRSDNISLQVSYPLLRSRSLTLLAKASIGDWRTVGTQMHRRRLRDRLRAARIGLEFSNEGATRFQGDVALSQGLGFAGMTRVGDPLSSRTDASGKFTKLAANLQVSRPLSDHVTIRAVAIAQYSDRPLLSGEEFSLGGNRVGRAFEFNLLTGDRGAGGGLELAFRPGSSKSNPSGLELYGFIDGGVTSMVKTRSDMGRSASLASAGPGARFSLRGNSISIDLGIPITAPRHSSPRLFVSLFRAF